MFIAVIAVTSLILLIGPFLLGSFLIRRFHTTWMLFIFGAFAFLAAQIMHSFLYNFVQGTDVFLQYFKDSPVNVLLLYGFLLALIQTVIRYAAIWFGTRYLGGQTRPWTGALTLAAGFGGADAVLTFAFSALYLLLGVITFPAAGSPLPEGVTPEQFATMQSQLNDLLNLSPIKIFLYSQFIPAVSLFLIEVTSLLITWVGAIQKKWLWVAASLVWQTAMIGLVSLSINWMNFYMTNDKLYGENLLTGGLLVLFVLALNLGVVYGIYKFVLPLIPADAMRPPTIAPSKPSSQVSAANQSSSRPAKRLKNTDLK